MTNDSVKIKNQAIAGFLGVLILLIIYSVFWGPLQKFGASFLPAKAITVSAQGKVTVSPDIAQFSFSVVSQGANPKTLADNNNKQMNAAIDFVKSQGIDEKDIKTTDYNLVPQYNYDRNTGKSYIYSYSLTQTVSVKVRALNKVADVLAGLPPLGINQISSITFSIDDPEKFLKDARDQAFDKAKEKAQEMAAENNASLGQVINFSDFQNQYITPMYDRSSVAMGMGAAPSVAPEIQSGSQEVTVNVSVTYELK